MVLSFRTRLTLHWTAAFGVLLAAALAAVYAGSRTYGYRDLDAQVRTLAATELASATDGEVLHLHEFPLRALNTPEFAGKFAQIYDADGRVYAESREIAGTGLRLPPEIIAAALAGEAPLVAVTAAGHPGRMAALRTVAEGRPWVVAVGLQADRLEASLARLAWLLAAVWAAGAALTAAIGFALASRALAPIRHVTARAAEIARGDFSARLDPPAVDDEIGRMSRLLNEMLERLHGALEANRRFAADASHELRSPLTAMAGEIDVALKRERTPEEYRETLRLLRERIGELTMLAENLMLLARAQERSPHDLIEEVPLTPLVEEAARRAAPAASARGITIAIDALPDLVVYGERRLLARVVDNLLANAVQYNREGGRVEVRGRAESGPVDGWQAGYAIVTVHDTGPGIPRAEWTRIFQRFFRLEPSRSRRTGGAGLGLAICQAIVELFRGTIRVADSGPAGTVIEVRLPGRAGGCA
jgi:two-component system OmpR family sensor kinase